MMLSFKLSLFSLSNCSNAASFSLFSNNEIANCNRANTNLGFLETKLLYNDIDLSKSLFLREIIALPHINNSSFSVFFVFHK